MDKFTNKLGKFVTRKYSDNTRNDIYNLIKENIDIRLDGYKNNTKDISLEGIEELTESLFNYIENEKIKHEILTLETIKLNLSVGHLNIKTINEHIDNLKEQKN